MIPLRFEVIEELRTIHSGSAATKFFKSRIHTDFLEYQIFLSLFIRDNSSLRRYSSMGESAKQNL